MLSCVEYEIRFYYLEAWSICICVPIHIHVHVTFVLCARFFCVHKHLLIRSLSYSVLPKRASFYFKNHVLWVGAEWHIL